MKTSLNDKTPREGQKKTNQRLLIPPSDNNKYEFKSINNDNLNSNVIYKYIVIQLIAMDDIDKTSTNSYKQKQKYNKT